MRVTVGTRVRLCAAGVNQQTELSLGIPPQGWNAAPLGAIAQSLSPSGATPVGCCQTVAVLFLEYSGF